MGITRQASHDANVTGGGTDWATSNYVPELYSMKVFYDFWAQSVYNEVCNTD